MSPLEIAAAHHNQGAAYWFLNTLSFIKVSGEQSGGAFALVEQMLPAGAGSPYHVHRRDTETFYVLDGKLTFLSEQGRISAAAGATIFLPPNQPHGFRAETAARVLILTTPSGFDRFVAAAGEPAQQLALPPPSEPDVGLLTRTAAHYGIEILGPLPG